jgi:hypothetical protein
MKLRRSPDGLIAQAGDGRWFALPGETDLVDFLARGGEARASAQATLDRAAADSAAAADPSAAILPFQPRSMRAFMLWEMWWPSHTGTLTNKISPTATP